jgi:hypothetical protein
MTMPMANSSHSANADRATLSAGGTRRDRI